MTLRSGAGFPHWHLAHIDVRPHDRFMQGRFQLRGYDRSPALGGEHSMVTTGSME